VKGSVSRDNSCFKNGEGNTKKKRKTKRGKVGGGKKTILASANITGTIE